MNGRSGLALHPVVVDVIASFLTKHYNLQRKKPNKVKAAQRELDSSSQLPQLCDAPGSPNASACDTDEAIPLA